MSWVTVGIAAVGATSGYLKGKRNEKIAKENNILRKAAIQYSPWTKMSDPGAGPVGPGAAEAGIGGGLQGAMMGSMLKGAGGAGAPPPGQMQMGTPTVDPTAFTPPSANTGAPTMLADAGAPGGMAPGSMDMLDPANGGMGKMGKYTMLQKMLADQQMG